MVTAIIKVAAIVIAVLTYSLCKVSSECSRIEEQESIDWAKKWNKQHNCAGDCGNCDDCEYHSVFREV
jgi:hypothetical protein